jgi:hypothetical protein
MAVNALFRRFRSLLAKSSRSRSRVDPFVDLSETIRRALHMKSVKISRKLSSKRGASYAALKSKLLLSESF